MNTIQLIEVGTVAAIPASEVKVGDERLYNYYGTAVVIKIIEKSAKTLTFITCENGKYYMFDIRKSTLVAINQSGLDVSAHTPKEAYNTRKREMVNVSEYFPVIEEVTAEEVTEEQTNELITFTNVEDSWNELKVGNKVLMNNDEMDSLQSYIDTLSDEEQDNYYHNFSSLYEKKYVCGLLTRCYVCELKSVNKEEVTEKVEIESIAFEWSESSLIKSNHTVHTMADAEMLVYRIACSIEENDGYCNKTGFLIKWTDGETYRGRIDILARDKNATTPLKDHVLAHCNFFAGNRPSHLNESDYQSMLRAYKVTEKEMQEYRDFMNKYLLVDVEKEEIKEEVINKPEVTEQPITEEPQSNKLNITVNKNKERNSVELSFSTKPDEDTRSLLKAHSFKWSRYNSVWYKKNPTESDYNMIKSLTGSLPIEGNSEVTESVPTFEYPEIDINDIETYAVPQDIQDREHDNNWVTRTTKTDHTKQLQNYFTDYNNQVTDLLQTTNNSRIIHDLKKSIQYFKKHYHETYVKYLSSKAAQPSWVTTGRGGMNVSRYNKAMNRIDSHMHKLTELQEDIEKRINKAKKDIAKEQKESFNKTLSNLDVSITFTMKKKEFTYMGITENRKVHTYNDYWIAKTWGCFRIFKGNREIHACKSKETLDHAIKYVVYHMNQENQKVG